MLCDQGLGGPAEPRDDPLWVDEFRLWVRRRAAALSFKASACAKVGAWEEATAALADAEPWLAWLGIDGSSVAAVSVATAASADASGPSAAQRAAAVADVRDALASCAALPALDAGHRAIVAAHGRKGDWQAALRVFERAQSLLLPLSERTLVTAMRSCAAHVPERCVELAQVAQQEHGRLSGHMLHVVCGALLDAGQEPRATQWLQRGADAGALDTLWRQHTAPEEAEVDLHGTPARLAPLLLRFALSQLRHACVAHGGAQMHAHLAPSERAASPPSHLRPGCSLAIVTGQGAARREEHGAAPLRDAVLACLRDLQPPLAAGIDRSNPGRVLVPAEALAHWMAGTAQAQ